MPEDKPDQSPLNELVHPGDGSCEGCVAPLVLYSARSRGIESLNNRSKIIFPLGILLDLQGYYFYHWHLSVAVAYLALLVVVYLWVRRKYERAVIPILDMRSRSCAWKLVLH